MTKEVDFFYLRFKDAERITRETEARLGVKASPLRLGRHSNINPSKGFIIFNGDGYQHHITRHVVKSLIGKRRAEGLSPFSYLHIDGHDDMAPMCEKDDSSFRSFVLGILKDNHGGVYFLEEGLTGERNNNVSLLTPIVDAQLVDWGPRTTNTRDPQVYVSIDFDVLDEGAGIHHLFPQTPIGFDIPRLLAVVEILGQRHRFIGVDLVGFSGKDASEEYVQESLRNIAKVTEVLVNIISRN